MEEAERKRIAWIAGSACVFFLLGLPLLLPTGHGHGTRPVRMVARLVAESSGHPIVGARVLVVSAYELEHGWSAEEAWAEFEQRETALEEIARQEGRPDPRLEVRLRDGGGRSGPDGRVEIPTGLATTIQFGWLWRRTVVQETRRRIAALWVAAEGADGVLVPVGEGTWRPAEAGENPGPPRTYDLGTVAVPRPPARPE